MSQYTHSEEVPVRIQKTATDSWHWSWAFAGEFECLDPKDKEIVLDQIAFCAESLKVGEEDSFTIDLPSPDPQVVREDNRQRAFAELKAFVADVERAINGLCEAEGVGFISPETPRAHVYQVIDIDRFCGTDRLVRGLFPEPNLKAYRDRVLETALDAYLNRLQPKQEEN